jgi:hypothetical protein
LKSKAVGFLKSIAQQKCSVWGVVEITLILRFGMLSGQIHASDVDSLNSSPNEYVWDYI